MGEEGQVTWGPGEGTLEEARGAWKLEVASKARPAANHRKPCGSSLGAVGAEEPAGEGGGWAGGQAGHGGFLTARQTRKQTDLSSENRGRGTQGDTSLAPSPTIICRLPPFMARPATAGNTDFTPSSLFSRTSGASAGRVTPSLSFHNSEREVCRFF